VRFTPRPGSYSALSLGLFAVAALSLIVSSTLLDATLGEMPFAVQRAIGLVTLVLPAAMGAVLGVLGFLRERRSKPLAAVATVLNLLFALFHASVLAFAG